ncbi:MAG: hypothetical protein GC129_02175 [Proteobacteria bacterium]|nr:hypothetical protein [Pseudomonadota bacterium]
MASSTPAPAIHGELKRDERAGSASQFGWVFAGFFALVALLPVLHGGQVRAWALALGAVFALVTLWRPHWLQPLNVVWHKFGLLLHYIVGPLVMGVLFFGTITPMGLWLRWRGKKLLALRFDPAAKSYWVKRVPPGPAPESFSDQF